MNGISKIQDSLDSEKQKINVPRLCKTLKAILPRSYEKTFDGVSDEDTIIAMNICVDGLTRDQVATGLNQVRDSGFCPDPSLFRKWCLGIKGFGNEQQRIEDSFRGKHAALANIVKFKNDSNHQLSNAEREAYNRCYELFGAIDFANNPDRAAYLAYEAFKDNYIEVIREFSSSGIGQEVIENKAAIDSKDKVNPLLKPHGVKHRPYG